MNQSIQHLKKIVSTANSRDFYTKMIGPVGILYENRDYFRYLSVEMNVDIGTFR